MSKERAVISPLAFEAEMRNVTRTLARDDGLEVVIGGDEAYTDGKTVVLPGIDRTKDMSVFEARVARGFVDHEAAHNRETDLNGGWVEKAKDHSKFAESMLQAVEDVRVEKRQVDKYNGSRTNLEATTQATLDLLLDRVEQGTVSANTKEQKHALLPFASTIAGRNLMNYGLQPAKVKKLEELCGPSVWQMASAIGQRAAACGTTEDAYRLAMWAVNNPPDEKDQNPPPPPPQIGAGQGSGQGKGKSDGQGGGEGDGQGKGAGGDPNDSGDGDGDGSNPDGAGHSGSPQTPEPVAIDFKDAVNQQMGGQLAGDRRGNVPYRALWEYDNFFSQKETRRPLDEAWKEMGMVSNRATPLLQTDANSHAAYRTYKERIGPQIGAIKMAFERYLMSQVNRGWEGGMLSGNVDPRRLAAAVAGSEAVFRKRDERTEIDTAVSILVDMSSSMGRGPSSKAMMATQVCIAVSEALSKVGVPFEITAHATSGWGFDQNSPADRKTWDERRPDCPNRLCGVPKFDANGDWEGWSTYKATRWVQQDFYVLKSFNETLFNSEGPIAGLADMAHGGTTEGDGVLKTYARLRTRGERRKVLMVLTDGGPGGYGPGDERDHIVNVIKHLSQDKSLHLMAIGIMSSAPESYYRNVTTVRDLNELPKVIFSKMKDALTVKKAA